MEELFVGMLTAVILIGDVAGVGASGVMVGDVGGADMTGLLAMLTWWVSCDGVVGRVSSGLTIALGGDRNINGCAGGYWLSYGSQTYKCEILHSSTWMVKRITRGEAINAGPGKTYQKQGSIQNGT
jgi:hypothetical protein